MLFKRVMLQQILQSKWLLQPGNPALPPLGTLSHYDHTRDHPYRRDQVHDKVLHHREEEEVAGEVGRVRKAADLARPEQVPQQVELSGIIWLRASLSSSRVPIPRDNDQKRQPLCF
jgi:hypothetical protein